jgi:hypothetical protein
MAVSPSNTEPGAEAGRIRCLYCGANNFPASPACWQCGRPLKAVPAGTAEAGAAPPPAPILGIEGSGAAPRPSASRPNAESALAPKAAAALGLMFPYVGLPLGIVFLMLDDPRKTQLGWLTIGWSVLGTVLNTVSLLVLLLPLLGALKGLPHPGGAAPGGLPSVPDIGGDGAGLLLPHLLPACLLAARFLVLHV